VSEQEIPVKIYGRLLHIPKSVGHLIEPHLCYEHVYVDYERGNYNTYAVTRKVYSSKGDDIVTFSGFEDRICEVLKRYNYIPKVEHNYPLLAPEIDRLAPTLTSKQLDILFSMALKPNGVYQAPTGYGKSFLIRQFCCMYPDSRIIIASKGRAVVHSLARELSNGLEAHLNDVTSTGIDDPDKRIALVTSWSIVKLDTSKYDVLIFDEVHQAAEPKNFNILSQVHIPRFYGFSATPENRRDQADILIEALFGPIRVEVTFDEGIKDGRNVPMHVYLYPIASGGALKKISKPSSYQRKSIGIWHNSYRNRVIAELTRYYVSKGNKILVLTEKIQHAKAIQEYLPEAEIASGKSKDLRDLLDRFVSGEVNPVISTFVWGAGINVPDLDIIIRADALSTEIPNIQASGRAARVSEGKEFGIIIDFDDRFDFATRNSSARRIDVYRSRGWTIHSKTLPPSLSTSITEQVDMSQQNIAD